MVQLDGCAGMVSLAGILHGNQHRLYRSQIFGIFGAAQRQVQLCQGIHQQGKFRGMLSNGVRQTCQDAPFLVPFGKLQFMPAVVQFHHHQWFHEQSLPGGGLIVNDGAQPALKISPQRDDVTPVALGDDAFLQDGGILGVIDNPLQAAEQPFVRHLDLGANRCQLGGSCVQDFTPVGNGAGNGFNQACRGCKRRTDFRQARVLPAQALKCPCQVPPADQGVLDFQQLARHQDGPACCPVCQGADVCCPANRDFGLDAQQNKGFPGDCLARLRLVQPGGGAQCQHHVMRCTERRIASQPFQDFGKLQCNQRFLVHNRQSVPQIHFGVSNQDYNETKSN